MNKLEQLLPTETRTAIEKYFTQIRLARATELARSRRFFEAEAVLIQNGEFPNNPRDLDLLARIAALQGRFGDARRLWNAAMQKDPQNVIYQECLGRLTPVKRINRLIASSRDTVVIILAWLTIGVAIAALTLVFHFK